jgi:exodeoxyribonuclease VII small subunit
MPKSSKKSTPSFADQFQALEQVVERLESGRLSLDQSLTEFESGLKLAQELQQSLQQTAQHIETLKATYKLDEE